MTRFKIPDSDSDSGSDFDSSTFHFLEKKGCMYIFDDPTELLIPKMVFGPEVFF